LDRMFLTRIFLCCLFFLLLQGQSFKVFNLENWCTNTVWFDATSGAAGSCSAGCPTGSSCNSANGICYWNIPTPTNGNFRLDPNGGTNALKFPIYSNSVVWSGNLGGCLNGTCNNSPSQCDSTGCGVINGCPQTRAEFTLSLKGNDFYDVEVINGFNLPIAVYPEGSYTSTGPYICGSPGAPVSLTGTGNCSWNFIPPSGYSQYYNWVSSGGNSCTSNNGCSVGTVCGLDQNLQMNCGNLLGYWTADQICGNQGSFGNPFNCTAASTSNPGDTYWNLYACNGGIGSCYQPGASSSCCGCQNWNKVGIYEPSGTTQCVNINNEWVSVVLPTLQWLKAGVPNVYTYPFDDPTSTFQCGTFSSGINIQNYKIVFCPNLSSQYSSTSSSATGSSSTTRSSFTTGSNSLISGDMIITPTFLFIISFIILQIAFF